MAYAAIICLAILTGVLIARRTQSELNLSGRQKAGVLLGAWLGAMIGAKLPFVFSDWQGLLSGAAWFSDGKTILTGLAGGYLGVEIAKWCMEIRTKTGDSFAAPVAATIAIGRIGCFVGGCCYGTPCNLPWGVVFPHVDLQPRHPTQLYEAAFHATCAVVLYYFQQRGWFRTNLIKCYIIAYAVYRIATETIRPEARLAGGLTGYQWSSLVLIVLFGWIWWRDARLLTSAERMSPCELVDIAQESGSV